MWVVLSSRANPSFIMVTTGLSTVLVTFPDRTVADAIVSDLMEVRLIACANLFPVESSYRWEGKVEHASEWVALLKIRDDDFQKVKERVIEGHPYQVPCIVRYEIADGHPPYLEWIRASTAPPQGD
jgi:periplasmic divalent cation tolerance protein